jgi:hypothetical protein
MTSGYLSTGLKLINLLGIDLKEDSQPDPDIYKNQPLFPTALLIDCYRICGIMLF